MEQVAVLVTAHTLASLATQTPSNLIADRTLPVIPQFVPSFIPTLLPSPLLPHAPELSHHLLTSFGSPARLDYGTGHELSFLAFLLILRLLGQLTPADEQAIVTRVFVAYFDLVRRLQKRFRLEPAGSKGVWGLDDHQHLSYLWGASQLRSEHTMPAPSMRV